MNRSTFLKRLFAGILIAQAIPSVIEAATKEKDSIIAKGNQSHPSFNLFDQLKGDPVCNGTWKAIPPFDGTQRFTKEDFDKAHKIFTEKTIGEKYNYTLFDDKWRVMAEMEIMNTGGLTTDLYGNIVS